MAKKPAPSYAGLSLDAPGPAVPPEASAEEAAVPVPEQTVPVAPAGSHRNRPQADTKGDKAQPYVAYLHPAGHRALRLYSIEAGTSVQGIIMEALEGWAKKHGITEPMRPLRTK